MPTAELYSEFAIREARGISPTYERLALAVSRDATLLALLDLLPVAKRYASLPEPPDNALYNVLSLDGNPLAWTRSHGQAMTWFG